MHSKEENREFFKTILNDCYKMLLLLQLMQSQPFPAKPLLMASLPLSQHQMINWLTTVN
jgi:hypothetical protein